MNREPGWYTDPYFHKRERYWDGTSWADEVREPEPEEPDPGAPPAATTSPPSPSAADRPADTASTAAAAATAAARAAGRASSPDPATAAYPKVDPPTGIPGAPPDDPMITGVVPAQADDLMITGLVPAQSEAPTAEPPTGTTSAQPSAPPTPTAPVGRRTVSGSVPPTPPPAARDETSPPVKISSRPVSPLSDPLTTMTVAAAAEAKGDRTAHQRSLVVVAAVVVVLVVVAAGAYLIFGDSSSSGASNQVTNAAHYTLQKHSVDVSFSVTAVSSGPLTTSGSSGSSGSSALTGSGSLDLTSDSGNMTLTPVGGGSQGTEQVLFIGKTFYVSFSGVSVLEPGKRWISADHTELASATSAVGSGTSTFVQVVGNPAASVQQLESSGLGVTSLGASTYEGTAVRGYKVVLNGSADGATNGVSVGSHGSETVYVTSSHLVRAIVVPVTVDVNGASFSETLAMVFTNYGTPISVTTPPASEVVSFSQYESIQNAAPGA